MAKTISTTEARVLVCESCGTSIEAALDDEVLEHQEGCLHVMLARAAIREGDVASAERWLAGSKPRSKDLENASEHRVARAMIDTARNDPGAVLTALGSTAGEIPIHEHSSLLAGLLRANALELRGDFDGAVEALEELSKRGGACTRAEMDSAIEKFRPLRLCRRSLPAAHAARLERVRRTPHSVSVVVGVGWALLLVVAALPVLGGVRHARAEAWVALSQALDVAHPEAFFSTLVTEPASDLLFAIITETLLIGGGVFATLAYLWSSLRFNRLLAVGAPAIAHIKTVKRYGEPTPAGDGYVITFTWTHKGRTHQGGQMIYTRGGPPIAGSPIRLLVDPSARSSAIVDPD